MRATQRFWRDNAELRHITPADDRWPEGFDVHATLRELIPFGPVLDFGCGDGRMTEAFPPGRYLGVDINPSAISHCRERYSDYRFELAAHALPNAGVALCYTVLLHVPDEVIAETAERLADAAERVMVVEILGRKFRRPSGVPPVFNREMNDYAYAFAQTGMSVHAAATKPYRRYGGVDITFIDFRK